MNKIDNNFVDQYVASWESRHDDWVRDFLASAIASDHNTFHGIKYDLKNKLENDWRTSLAFLLDRTTYQSRGDILNQKTANYLFNKICSLSSMFSNESLKNVIKKIREDKITGKITHIREEKDIERLESIAEFIIRSPEKNMTKVILTLIDSGRSAIRFLQQFHQIGPKTASFYMKFIYWLFELTPDSPDSIVIDTHVINMLIKLGEIINRNTREARNAIIRLSKQLNRSEVEIETALYEADWQGTNRQANHCN